MKVLLALRFGTAALSAALLAPALAAIAVDWALRRGTSGPTRRRS